MGCLKLTYQTDLPEASPLRLSYKNGEVCCEEQLTFFGSNRYGNNNPIMFNDPLGLAASNRAQPLMDEYTPPDYTSNGDWNPMGGRGGSWADSYGSYSMSGGDFINSALKSEYGGSWSDGQAYYFKSDEEA